MNDAKMLAYPEIIASDGSAIPTEIVALENGESESSSVKVDGCEVPRSVFLDQHLQTHNLICHFHLDGVEKVCGKSESCDEAYFFSVCVCLIHLEGYHCGGGLSSLCY